jgi:hypothetical protein
MNSYKLNTNELSPNELYIYEKSPTLYEAIKNKNLWLVRSFTGFNKDEKNTSMYKNGSDNDGDLDNFLNINKSLNITNKPVLNHSINTLVIPFSQSNNWECGKYILVSPMSEYIGELIGGTQKDYITIGNHKFTSETYFLVPNDELNYIKTNFTKLQAQIIGYDYPNELSNKTQQECMSKVKQIYSAKKFITPRIAVENLLTKISQDLGYDIWRINQELLSTIYDDTKVQSNNYKNNPYSIRLDKKGIKINIDEMLDKFATVFDPDTHSLVVNILNIQTIKRKIILNDVSNCKDKNTFNNEKKNDCNRFICEFDNLIDQCEILNVLYQDSSKCFCLEIARNNISINRDLYNLEEGNDDYNKKSITSKSIKYNDTTIKFLESIVNKSYTLGIYLEILFMLKNKYDNEELNNFLTKYLKSNDENLLNSLYSFFTQNKDIIDTLNNISLITDEICFVTYSYTNKNNKVTNLEVYRQYDKYIRSFKTKINYIANLIYLNISRQINSTRRKSRSTPRKSRSTRRKSTNTRRKRNRTQKQIKGTRRQSI